MWHGLTRFRREIDDVDRRIVELLAARFQIIERVAYYKSKNRIPARIATRVNTVVARNEAAGQGLGLPRRTAANIWKTIVNEACKLEERIILLQDLVREELMAKKVKRKASIKKSRKAKPAAKKPAKRKAAKAVKKKVPPKKPAGAAAKRSVPAKAAKRKSPGKKPTLTGTHVPAAPPVFIEQNTIPAPPSHEPVTPALDPVAAEVNEDQPDAAPENSENGGGTEQSKE